MLESILLFVCKIEILIAQPFHTVKAYIRGTKDIPFKLYADSARLCYKLLEFLQTKNHTERRQQL